MMSGEIELESSVQPEPHDESPPAEGSAPPTIDMSRPVNNQIIMESLVDNMFNLFIESYMDDVDGESPRGPRVPFPPSDYMRIESEEPFIVLSDYIGIDTEKSDIDYKISKIDGLEHMEDFSPLWYKTVKPHLTQLERQELWDRTPEAFTFFWDDSDNTVPDDDEFSAPPTYVNLCFNF